MLWPKGLNQTLLHIMNTNMAPISSRLRHEPLTTILTNVKISDLTLYTYLHHPYDNLWANSALLLAAWAWASSASVPSSHPCCP